MIPPTDENEDISHAEFWTRFRADVIAQARWLRVPEEDVEDVVHLVVQKSQKKWDTRHYKNVAGSRGWVNVITRNTTADYFRSRRREQERRKEFPTVEASDLFLEGLESPHPYFNAEEWLQIREREQLLWEAVLELNEIDFFLVVHHYYEEIPILKVAEALQMPYETAKKRLQRVLSKLYKHLEKRGLAQSNL